MRNWMYVDTFNRLTHFKQFFKKCFKLDYQSQQFVENEVFSSDIFSLLPLEFQNELKEFAKKTLQQSLKQLHFGLFHEKGLMEQTNLLYTEITNDLFQQLPNVEMVSPPVTVTDLVKKEAKQLLASVNEHGTVEFYDSQHKRWLASSASLELPVKQYEYKLALVGNVLYAYGGKKYISYNHKTYKDNASNRVWSRDLSDSSSQWTARADMNQGRSAFTTAVLNNSIYVFSGWGKRVSLLSTCERFDSQLNQWSMVAKMTTGRWDASAAVLNGCIYIAGGLKKKGYERSVKKYDPLSNKWSHVAPMTTARAHFALTPFAGYLWAIGGEDAENHPLSTCESYDPVTNSWREEAPMKGVRRYHSAIEYYGELYVVSGKRNNGETKLLKKFFFKQIFKKRCLFSLLDFDNVVEKYVPNIGWLKDSIVCFARKSNLLVIPEACSFFLHLT